MEKTIGIAEARDDFAELVNRVAFGGECYVVQRRGKPLVAVIGVGQYHQMTRLLAEIGVPDEIHGIPVRIRLETNRVFVSDDQLDLYGVGDTLEEAKQDYWLAVQDYYADLSQHAEHLAEHMEEHLRFLRPIFDAVKD
jgi:prevent-host-death family protein